MEIPSSIFITTVLNRRNLCGMYDDWSLAAPTKLVSLRCAVDQRDRQAVRTKKARPWLINL